jgi:hypothetical protein
MHGVKGLKRQLAGQAAAAAAESGGGVLSVVESRIEVGCFCM